MQIVRRPDKCVSKLARCEVKRTPVNAARSLVGYYFGCPHCGRTTAVSVYEATFTERGLDVGEVPKLSMTKAMCGRCEKMFAIVEDEVVLDP